MLVLTDHRVVHALIYLSSATAAILQQRQKQQVISKDNIRLMDLQCMTVVMTSAHN